MQFLCLVFAALMSCALSFQMKSRQSMPNLRMSTTEIAESVKITIGENYPRKIKRQLRTVTAESFASTLYKPEYDNYLKNVASKAMYNNIMKLYKRKADDLNIKLSAEFAYKPPIVLPDLVETAVAAGKFEVL
jgi:hypothetical protein